MVSVTYYVTLDIRSGRVVEGQGHGMPTQLPGLMRVTIWVNELRAATNSALIVRWGR